MNIPSKIYVRKVHLEDLAENDCMLGDNLPVGKLPFPMEEYTCVEYINIASAWHDAKVEKTPHKVSENNAVLVVGLREGRIAYRSLRSDKDSLWQDFEFLLDLKEKKLFDKVLWAYLKDVVPFLNND